jgi:uncharacterized protein YprB with RNaseH-like and TPR domain
VYPKGKLEELRLRLAADQAGPDGQPEAPPPNRDLLAELRRKMADAAKRADDMVASAPPPPRAVRGDSCRVEDFVEGSAVQTPLGSHFESWRYWERTRRHGTMEVGRLGELPPELFDGIAQGELPAASPESWAFLDTETTGLAGGSGTCAFLVGVGRITPDGFSVQQFFMRDYGEEASQLHALSRALEGARVLVTYNGKAFDIPLLETRYRMARARAPFALMAHLDLLHGARRLWRLRYESCKLTELESRVLGLDRVDDVPGELIPYIYFDWVRFGRAERLKGVFHHNQLDIVTLACLTAIVPWAFRDPAELDFRHGGEFVSLGRWLRQAGRIDEAAILFRKALARPLADPLMFRTLWDLCELEKKRKRHGAALEHLNELAACRNPHRAAALEELAKHYEHREKDFARALEFAQSAHSLEPCAARGRRLARLRRLAALPQPGNLLCGS